MKLMKLTKLMKLIKLMMLMKIIKLMKLMNRLVYALKSINSVTGCNCKVQWVSKLSIKSRSRQLLMSLGRSRSRQPLNFLVSNSLGLDISLNFQSRKVSVSTSFVFWVSQIHCLYIKWNISTILFFSNKIIHKWGNDAQFPLNAYVYLINL